MSVRPWVAVPTVLALVLVPASAAWLTAGHPGWWVAGEVLVVALLAVAAGAALMRLLSRTVIDPLSHVSKAMQSIATGGFPAEPIAVDGPEEIATLAEAFNQMTDRVRANMAELERSRDELRRSVGRLGETLRSTHDLAKLLSVVLEAAAVTTRARGGVVYLLSATRRELFVKVARNVDRSHAARRVRVGDGAAGRAAAVRAAILVTREGEGPALSRSEPTAETVIAVPLESSTQLIGVLALYGRETGDSFTQADVETITSLARQAAIGIENVMLHQEAQRLSITDGLTGVWNHRYFQMRLAQEVERAIRFRRTLSLLVLDVDHFKAVNDRFGHQRGDAVLIELARRVLQAVRGQVDTVARYGGEEFVLILPETPPEGARIVSDKIREAVAAEPFSAEGEEPIDVTISIGGACFPQHGSTPQTLLRSADMAMYEAKDRGRDRVVMADELDRPPPLDVAGGALAEEPHRP